MYCRIHKHMTIIVYMFLQGTLSIQISIIHWYYCLIHSIKKTLCPLLTIYKFQLILNVLLTICQHLTDFPFSNWFKPNLHRYIKDGRQQFSFLSASIIGLMKETFVWPPPPSSLVSSNDPLSNVTYRGGDQTLLYFNPGHWQCSVTLADMLCTHRHWFLSTHNLLLLITG